MGLFASILGPVIGTGLSGLLGSLLGKHGGGSQARSLAELQAQLAMRQQEMAEDQYRRFLQNYGPVEQGLARFYQQPIEQQVSPYIAEGRRAIDPAYVSAKNELIRTLAANNIKGGQAARILGEFERNAVLDRADLGLRGRRLARAEMANFLGMGRGLPSQSIAALSTASGGLGRAQNYWQNVAAQTNQGLGFLGQGLGQIIGQYGPQIVNWLTGSPGAAAASPYTYNAWNPANYSLGGSQPTSGAWNTSNFSLGRAPLGIAIEGGWKPSMKIPGNTLL